EQLDLVPVPELVDAVGEHRHAPRNALPEPRQSGPARLLHTPLRYHEGTLPIVAAIEENGDAAGGEPAHGLVRIACSCRQAEPEHIHRRAQIFAGETRARANGRVAPVA